MTFVENPVEAPTVELRPIGIATTSYLEATGGPFDDGLHWLNGVVFPPLGCIPLEGSMVNEECDTDTLDPNEGPPHPEDCVEFQPMRIETNTSMPVVSGWSEEELRRRLTARALLDRSKMIAREVYSGDFTGNPSLVSEGMDVAAYVYAGAGPLGAIAAVEDWLGEVYGNGVGMIHVPPGALSALAGQGWFQRVDGQYRTATGHRVVGDAGYLAGAPGTGGVTPGRPWVYGSGPVYLKTSGTMANGEVWQRFEYKRNVLHLYQEEYALAYFEPCTVVAAQIPAVV